MKIRLKPHPVPEGRRIWEHDLGERGVHHFRMPRYTVAVALFALIHNGDANGFAGLALDLQSRAAAVGASWKVRAMDLESGPAPSTAAGLAEYGERVIDELGDHFDDTEIMAMGNRALDEMRERTKSVKWASARAEDFPDPPTAPEPAAEASDGPSSPEKSST